MSPVGVVPAEVPFASEVRAYRAGDVDPVATHAGDRVVLNENLAARARNRDSVLCSVILVSDDDVVAEDPAAEQSIASVAHCLNEQY